MNLLSPNGITCRVGKGARIEIGCCRFRQIFGAGQARLRRAVPHPSLVPVLQEGRWARFAELVEECQPYDALNLLVVRWVERSETHQTLAEAPLMVGFAALNPPYDASTWPEHALKPAPPLAAEVA
jgi:hypothetical protein